MPKPITLGRRERQTFSKINEKSEMPNLIQIQTDSYKWFLEKGLQEIFEDFSPIVDHPGNLELYFDSYRIDKNSKYDEQECKERDKTYEAAIYVKVRLVDKKTNEIMEKGEEVFLGNFPLMTDKGTFIYNGAERVVVTQLVRSPGAYFASELDKSNTTLYNLTVIPNRGAWLEYVTDSSKILYVKIDRNRKLPMTALLRAIGYESDKEILGMFGEDQRLLNTLEKDETRNKNEAIKAIYRKMRPGEAATEESATSLFESTYFDPSRYDLAKVGRYKINKKLGIADRVVGTIAHEDVIAPDTGEILLESGQEISKEKALEIQNAGVFSIKVSLPDSEDVVAVVGNQFVDITTHVDMTEDEADGLGLGEGVYYPAFQELVEDELKGIKLDNLTKKNKEKVFEIFKDYKRVLAPRQLMSGDILASVSYILGLDHGIGKLDDIDHLGNRRLRTVGELLQNQFRVGIARMERTVRERMTTSDEDKIKPNKLINIKPVTAVIREFFGSSQLSQFMDQNNPLAEITHKRRLSALGPGGLSRDRAGFEVRDVHYSHYGRMCPIETPEGPNIGLIGSLTTYAIINKYGFIETPYRVVKKGKGEVTDKIEYISADQEEEVIIAQANEPLDSKGKFVNKKVAARSANGEIDLEDRDNVDYMDVSPKQVVSVATAMIPFLENDDANRALMGANMQRQAVPLLITEAPIIGTGMEHKAAKDSGVVVIAKEPGVVEYVDADRIIIKRNKGNEKDEYKLLKFKRSNQGTSINQKPIVKVGEEVEAGEVIADGPSTSNGEISLGKNLLIGFMTWEGYNYEDAIILNEKLIMNDVLTSVHIEKYEVEARDTKLGPQEITRDIPNCSEEKLKRLDENGIIHVGAEVSSSDILVGRVTPKGETEPTPIENLMRHVFSEKARDIRDESKKVPHGENGIVVDVRTFERDRDELAPGINKMVRCYVATKRKISVGDKMAGRHGNKGVISKILPEEDMPFLEDGTPLQVMLNPLGVPSRMNVGQVLEVHLGLAAKKKGWHIATPVFDGATENDIIELLGSNGYDESGKVWLRDGRTGERFHSPVTIGYMYMLKLHHLVDDKIHARSMGPYSLVTQQPLGGKAQFGGQRFGEMEVWALEAYGAAHSLQEILTIKSDDMEGRVRTHEAIVKGTNIPKPGLPESFRVLVKELQSLGIDVKAYDEMDNEVSIRDAGSRSSFTSIENKVDNEARKKAEKEAEELYENEEEDVDEAEATEEGLEIKELQEDEDIIE